MSFGPSVGTECPYSLVSWPHKIFSAKRLDRLVCLHTYSTDCELSLGLLRYWRPLFAILRLLASKSQVDTEKSESNINYLVDQIFACTSNRLLYPFTVNILIKISCNDAICTLPKDFILNVILIRLDNDFCSIVVSNNNCFQVLRLLIVNACISTNDLPSNYFPPFKGSVFFCPSFPSREW